ncbi:MAG: hypothetical protein HY343_03510 [Lentisphaerae bacterium]|nr:hypothetical protein [Lentisphaerota bacterium]
MKTNYGMIVAGCLMIGALNAMAQTAPAEAAKPTPEFVKVGAGNLTVSGLLQGWYQFTDEATPEDTFRLRRAEIKLSGEITPMVPWAVMIDPAQVREDDTTTSTVNGTNYVTSVGRKSVLQDFLVTLKLHPTSAFDIGQYKTPFGMEGLESSAKLDLIERSMLASQLKWADYRDIGVTYKGNFTCPFTGAKIQPSAGIYNGDGQNRLDANNPMAYAGRLAVKPVDALHLGVAHYNGDTGSAETENHRTGVEAKIAVNPVSVYGEYAMGESAGKDKETAYVTATCMLGELFQAVARYDWYDPDEDADDDAKDETTLGVNYFIKKHNAKLALNYVFRGEEGASTDNDIVRALAQVSF